MIIFLLFRFLICKDGEDKYVFWFKSFVGGCRFVRSSRLVSRNVFLKRMVWWRLLYNVGGGIDGLFNVK